MPKTRPYTRQELKGLRRADLQSLCKTYDIKGANAKTDVLVETLATYFTSPAYLSSPRPERPRPVPRDKSHAPTRLLHPIPRRLAKPKPVEAPATAALDPSAESCARRKGAVRSDHEGFSTRQSGKAAQVVLVPKEASASAAVPSDSQQAYGELASLRQDVDRLNQSFANLQQEQERLITKLVHDRVEEQIAAILHRQSILNQRELDIEARERRLEAALVELDEKVRGSSLPCADTSSHQPGTSTLLQPGSTGRKKRQTDLSDPEALRAANKSKRRRLGSSESSPHTPLALFSSLHSDSRPPSACDAPQTPPGNVSSHMTAKSIEPGGVARSETRLGLNFSTTPRPPLADPPSPTDDHLHLLAHREGASTATPATDSRPGTSQARRHISAGSASKAHMILHSMADEPSSLLGPLLSRKDTIVTPPTLSPSPSISGDNFNYTTMPKPQAAAVSMSAKQIPSSDDRTSVLVPSPRREYMDVALNGIATSPSAVATPTSRTMLGTERYRDTRFRDEPFVPWASPGEDFGSFTPSH